MKESLVEQCHAVTVTLWVNIFMIQPTDNTIQLHCLTGIFTTLRNDVTGYTPADLDFSGIRAFTNSPNAIDINADSNFGTLWQSRGCFHSNTC